MTPAATPSSTHTATHTATPTPTPIPSVISRSAAISDDNTLIAFVSVELSAPAITARGRSSQSLIFADFAAMSPGGAASSRLLMLDEHGETVWIYRRANFGAAHILPNGNLMYMRRGGPDRPFYEITPLGEIVNRAAVGDKDDAPHHDFMALDERESPYPLTSL